MHNPLIETIVKCGLERGQEWGGRGHGGRGRRASVILEKIKIIF